MLAGGGDTGPGEVPLGRVGAHPLEALPLADWSQDAWGGVERPSPWAPPVFPGSLSEDFHGLAHLQRFPPRATSLYFPHLLPCCNHPTSPPPPPGMTPLLRVWQSHYSGMSELSPPLRAVCHSDPRKGRFLLWPPSPHRTLRTAACSRASVSRTGLETQSRTMHHAGERSASVGRLPGCPQAGSLLPQALISSSEKWGNARAHRP